MIGRLILSLAILIAATASSVAQERERYVFAAISTERSEAAAETWAPFVEAMSDTTGYDIELVSANDYAGVIEALRFGQAQIGWFSTYSGLQAVRLADAEVFAKTIFRGGAHGYNSIIVVRRDSPIRTLEDLLACDQSISFGLGDPNSTSGTLVPNAYVFAPRGIDPQSCFAQVTNANHEQNFLAVINGFVDAATNNTQSLSRLRDNRPELLDELRIIWTSPLIPTEPLIWRRDLPQDVKDRLMQFFLTYGFRGDAEQRAREQAVLYSLQLSGFLPANEEHLLPARRLELIGRLTEAQADPTLSDAERVQQVASLRTELAEVVDAERRVAVRELQTELTQARDGLEVDAAAAQARAGELIDGFLQTSLAPVDVARREVRHDTSALARAGLGLGAGLGVFGLVLLRTRPVAHSPARAISDRFVDAIIWGGLVGLLVWSFWPAEMFKLPLLAENADRMGQYLAGFLRPDLTDWRLYAEQTIVTVQIALWGTVVAVLAAVPFGLLASRNIAPVWIVQPVRRLMDAFRAINELVVAAVFVAAVGLGPFAGVMALALHTTGVLAKLFSEAVESIDDGPVEGVRATGAGPLNEVVWGVIPQVIPLWASYALYRFESNTRAATILGLIGAGGIGQILIQNIRAFEYGKTATILLIIVAAVMLVDLASQMLRKRLV